jgi:hypothetical protein
MSSIQSVSGQPQISTRGVQAMLAAKGGNTPAQKPSLDSIERNYQVAEEKSEKWSPKLFGSIPIGTLGGERELTVTEGKLLDNLTRDRGINGLQKFKDIADDAFKVADARVPPGETLPAHLKKQIEVEVMELPKKQRAAAREAITNDLMKSWPRNDGHNDAFRHAYWNARLTSQFGAEWTKQFTTAHEGSNPGNSTREAMDLYNNEVGRKIALANPKASPQELADLVKAALDKGELVVIGKNGHLAWSNEVARNDHGVTIDLDGVPNKIQTPKGNVSAN